jgi:enoyl-[acyl-carrier protein] reductase I
MNIDLSGKKILVLGVSNDKSIGWAITKNLHDAGAEIALSYAGEALEKRVKPLAEQIDCSLVYQCDLRSDTDTKSLIDTIHSKWGTFDGVVHSVAFASKEDLQGRFSDTSRQGFSTALDVSCYSLVSLAGLCRPYLNKGASILTLTYLGSQRAIQNYNVMGVAKAALEASVRYLAADLGPQEGIRVNAISAGPIKTLAASGIPGFRDMLGNFESKAPLRRKVELDEVGKTGLFLMSDFSSGITGEITWVDCGYSIVDSAL